MPQQVFVDPNKKVTLRTPPKQAPPNVTDIGLQGLRSLGIQLPERVPVDQRVPLPKGRSFAEINPWLDRANRLQYGLTGINLDNTPVTGGLMDSENEPDPWQAPGELVGALPGPTDLFAGLKGLGALGGLGGVSGITKFLKLGEDGVTYVPDVAARLKATRDNLGNLMTAGMRAGATEEDITAAFDLAKAYPRTLAQLQDLRHNSGFDSSSRNIAGLHSRSLIEPNKNKIEFAGIDNLEKADPVTTLANTGRVNPANLPYPKPFTHVFAHELQHEAQSLLDPNFENSYQLSLKKNGYWDMPEEVAANEGAHARVYGDKQPDSRNEIRNNTMREIRERNRRNSFTDILKK